jgi:hypothetical protein
MANEPVAPDDGAATLSGSTSYVHGAAACVIVNVRPPAVMVPVSGDVVGLGATL